MIQQQQLPKTLFRFGMHFFKKWPYSFMLFFLAPLSIVLDANVMPYALKMLVDAITAPDIDKQNIFTEVMPALLLGGGGWLILIIILRVQHWWQAYVIPEFQADIRLSVLDYVTNHSYQYFANQSSGNIANKVNDLARAIETIRMIVTWNIITTASVTIVAMAIMLTISYKFALLLFVWMVLIISLSVYKAKNVNAIAKDNADHKSQLSGVVVDVLSNILSVKLFARRKYEQNYVLQTQLQEQVSNKQLIIATNVYWLMFDIAIYIMLAIFVYLMIEYWRRDLISTGDVVFIFNTAFVIINNLWNLGFQIIELLKNIGTARQALALISQEHDIVDKPDAKDLEVTKGLIEFNNVTFHYKQGTKIFNNKSIIIKPSEKVGLVGYSGSGKSSFVNLILRFYDVESGVITIDNQNIAEVTQESLRHSISMIPQDTSLFHRTLLENIKYGNPDAQDKEAIEAAKLAHCHEFITKLKDGYNTLVGERGIKLSGGQRQRIAIARAMLENANILILDEATSALDSMTEQLIQESLLKLMENKTTIVVAHRLSTLLHMDRILVFNNGKIIEDGSHQDLLAKNGHYAKLWSRQVGGFLPETKNKKE